MLTVETLALPSEMVAESVLNKIQQNNLAPGSSEQEDITQLPMVFTVFVREYFTNLIFIFSKFMQKSKFQHFYCNISVMSKGRVHLLSLIPDCNLL